MNKSKLEFRNYEVSNYEECLELFEANCPAYFAVEEREDYREFLKSINDQYFLGYVNGSLMCCFGITNHSKGLSSLSWIMVRPSQHKKGYGHQMMSHFFDNIQDQSLGKVLVATSQHANKFFEKYGAEQLEFIEDGWGKGMHKINMEIVFP